MKRLKKLTHLVLVWVSVCLLCVDPASACRLLGNRRCCSCCCPCPPVTCGCDTPGKNHQQAPLEHQPSPSDAPPAVSSVPPGISTDAGQSPAPLAAPSPPVNPSRTSNDSPAPASNPTEPVIVDLRVPSPAAVPPAARTITEPFAAPPPAGQTASRQPALAPSAAAIAASPPAVDHAPVRSSQTAELTPQPATLTPRQAFGTTNTPTKKAGEPGSRQPSEPEVGSIARPDSGKQETGDRGQETGTARGGSRTPASPGSIAPAAPVTPPAFPPVSDDPFAPLAPSTAAPASSQPPSDDPFAPLNPTPAAEPKPPIVSEPAMKLNDMLLPGPDGRLPMREWSDNSGRFQVKARLISILDGKVRLLKETGRTTTVSVDRLSTTDRTYVDQIINRYGKDLATLQLVSR